MDYKDTPSFVGVVHTVVRSWKEKNNVSLYLRKTHFQFSKFLFSIFDDFKLAMTRIGLSYSLS